MLLLGHAVCGDCHIDWVLFLRHLLTMVANGIDVLFVVSIYIYMYVYVCVLGTLLAAIVSGIIGVVFLRCASKYFSNDWRGYRVLFL